MKGTLIVSLDFELFWGMLEVCPLEDYQDNVLGGRAAIPRLLALFEKYGIHATWATVGFLFAENYEELSRYFPEACPTYADQRITPYPWFSRIGGTEQEAPCFFGGSLLPKIAKTPGQEIGSHTFSHFYCREKGQTPEQFRADMEAALAIARDKGYPLTSAVMPRNHCEPEYTEILKELGFTAYRDEENDWCHRIPWRPLRRMMKLTDVYFPITGLGGYRPQKENGIWNLTGSRMYKAILPPLAFLERVKLWRIKSQMRHAAMHGLTFHLWWHPHNLGVRTDAHFAQLEEIFSYFRELQRKYGMQSRNMGEAARAEEEAWKRS